jgi:hypothetical protein
MLDVTGPFEMFGWAVLDIELVDRAAARPPNKTRWPVSVFTLAMMISWYE